jgi:hypothetical protein
MRFFCSLSKIFVFVAVFVGASALYAQDGWHSALHRLQSSNNQIGALSGPSLVAADFNHDGYPDGALLIRNGNGLWIEIYFRSDPVKRVSLSANPGDLAISAVDVNHDGSPDLVVEDPFWHQRLFVWLNDGRGKFSAASVTDTGPAQQSTHTRATGPSTNKECSELIRSSKVRSRHATGYSTPHTPVRYPNLFIREFVRDLTLSHAASNGVRGSPVLLA